MSGNFAIKGGGGRTPNGKCHLKFQFWFFAHLPNLLCLLDHPVILTPCRHLLLQAAVDQVQPLFQPAPGVYLEAVVKTTSTSPGFLRLQLSLLQLKLSLLQAFCFNLMLKTSFTRFPLLQGLDQLVLVGLQRGPLMSHFSLCKDHHLKLSGIL